MTVRTYDRSVIWFPGTLHTWPQGTMSLRFRPWTDLDGMRRVCIEISYPGWGLDFELRVEWFDCFVEWFDRMAMGTEGHPHIWGNDRDRNTIHYIAINPTEHTVDVAIAHMGTISIASIPKNDAIELTRCLKENRGMLTGGDE